MGKGTRWKRLQKAIDDAKKKRNKTTLITP